MYGVFERRGNVYKVIIARAKDIEGIGPREGARKDSKIRRKVLSIVCEGYS